MKLFTERSFPGTQLYAVLYVSDSFATISINDDRIAAQLTLQGMIVQSVNSTACSALQQEHRSRLKIIFLFNREINRRVRSYAAQSQLYVIKESCKKCKKT